MILDLPYILIHLVLLLSAFQQVNSFSFDFERVTHCVMETSAGCIHWQSELHFEKPDDAACFPAATYVQSRQRGRIALSQLQVGQEILVMDVQEGKTTYQPIIAWLHRQTQAEFQFQLIQYQIADQQNLYQNGVYMSGMHNIALFDSQSSQIYYKFAQSLQEGEQLLSFGPFLDFSSPKVQTTQKRKILKGIYAPYTSRGQPQSKEMILVHCFAHVSTQYHKIFDWMIRLYPAWNLQPQEESYMHPLSRYLKDFFPSVLQIRTLEKASKQHNTVKNGEFISSQEFRSQSHGTEFQDFKQERKVLLIIDKIFSSPEAWQ